MVSIPTCGEEGVQENGKASVMHIPLFFLLEKVSQMCHDYTGGPNALHIQMPEDRYNMFNNGAGKLLRYELLMMTGDFSAINYHVAVSTTGHPLNDWCGISGDKCRGDLIAWGAEITIVGEVKGAGTETSGLCQLFAEMQTLKDTGGTWPIRMW